MNHCLVFDIGKTNKKAFVFDERYQVVFSTSIHLPETTDDEGMPCEDLVALEKWINHTVGALIAESRFRIRAVNASAYGASFVHLDEALRPVTPLYNYLKPYPSELSEAFFATYGNSTDLQLATASPFLGHLNSGLQLYWLKQRKPALFRQIRWSMHLPQWVAQVVRTALDPGAAVHAPITCDATSLGCHTMLWDFRLNDYHAWVRAEGLEALFSPETTPAFPETSDSAIVVGTGLHDSSAALLPYLIAFQEPFVLLSTGTWCISLNPFNSEPLTSGELAQDCLCYLNPEGKQVKAARYFGGNEHELAVAMLTRQHDMPQGWLLREAVNGVPLLQTRAMAGYLAFMEELVGKQLVSLRLAMGKNGPSRLFIDGGFARNKWYLRGLAAAFPEVQVFSAEVAQASALGAALALQAHWNPRLVPSTILELQRIWH